MSDPSQSPSEGRRSESVLGPFTARDLTLFGGVLITFVASLLPLFGPGNLWNAAGLYFLGIGILVPVATAALFAWRRLEPARRLRVGSLSLDQFASVASILSAAFYFLGTVTTLSPGAVAGLLGGLAMLAATTLARLIPAFAADFLGRPEVPAHVVARDAVPPAPRPAGAGKAGRGSKRGAGSSSAAGSGAAGSGAAGNPWGSPGTNEWGGPLAPPSGRPGEAAAVPGAGPATGGSVEPFGGTPAGPTAPAAAGAEPSAPAAEDDGAPERAIGALGAADGEAYGAPVAETAPEGRGTTAPAEPEGPAERATAEPVGSAESVPPAGAGEPVTPAGRVQPVETAAPAGPAEPVEPVAPTVAAEPAASAEPVEPVAPTEIVGAAGAEPATAVFPAAGTGGAADRGGAGQGNPAEDIGATRPYDDSARYEAFWFAVSQPRTAVDASTGQPVFSLEPGQWILALQDRGQEFVVQSPDGRVGVLRDLSGIERA